MVCSTTFSKPSRTFRDTLLFAVTLRYSVTYTGSTVALHSHGGTENAELHVYELHVYELHVYFMCTRTRYDREACLWRMLDLVPRCLLARGGSCV